MVLTNSDCPLTPTQAFTGTSKHGDHFALFESTDLASYTPSGHVFPSGAHGAPAWAFENYWAPEIHAVPTPSGGPPSAAVQACQSLTHCLNVTTGVQFNVYFAARCTATKQLSIGVATAKQPTGPFTDIGQPLVGGTDMGYIGTTCTAHAQHTTCVAPSLLKLRHL